MKEAVHPSVEVDDLDEYNAEHVVTELKRALAVTEDIFNNDFFRVTGVRYRPVKLVIADENTRSLQGWDVSIGGPAYYRDEEKIYFNPSFFSSCLRRVLPEVRKATLYYNVFHEVGHHVQKILGTLSPISSTYPTRLQNVGRELQADFVAGMLVNASHRRFKLLSKGDKEAILSTAFSIGDDAMLKAHGLFGMTHGSNAMRYDAVERGFSAISMRDVPTVDEFCKEVLKNTKTQPKDWL